MVVREVPELLGLVEAPLQVLRGHEVLGHLDAVVDVPHLGADRGKNRELNLI